MNRKKRFILLYEKSGSDTKMNWSTKFPLNGIKDEAEVLVEYDKTLENQPVLQRYRFSLNRDVAPNALYKFKIRAEVPLKDNVQAKGKADVLGYIPCFREELNQVHQLMKNNALKHLPGLIKECQSKVSQEKLKILREAVKSNG